MFAIAFDLAYAETQARHPKSLRQAYKDIERTRAWYDFHRVQQSVYHADREDLANLMGAMTALQSLPWFPDCVKDIKGYRLEMWSDFTPMMKGSNR
jgi:virulence-associated protein VapD